MRGSDKYLRPSLELCTEAGEMLKRAGFILHHVSRGTEACYYRLPDRGALLRVAAHSNKQPLIGHPPVAARVTFNGTHVTAPAYIKIADQKVEAMVALAIGQYMLKTGAATTSRVV